MDLKTLAGIRVLMGPSPLLLLTEEVFKAVSAQFIMVTPGTVKTNFTSSMNDLTVK